MIDITSFPMFHWSPLDLRPLIDRKGLCPHSLSREGEWHPPYLCFSRSPSHAWALSGQSQTDVEWWGLWMVWSYIPSDIQILQDNVDADELDEYRVYEPISPDDIWFVGIRSIQDEDMYVKKEEKECKY